MNKFEQRFNSIPPATWAKIAKIDGLNGQWISGVKLDAQVLSRLKKSVLITSTGSSTRIEGSRLSDEDVEKLMKGIDIQKFTDRDIQEVKGYFELLENVFNSYKSIKFSENTIKHFHQELLKYVEKDKLHRGEYKKQENKVHMVNEKGESIGVLFDTTPAYLTPKEMQELCEWTEQALVEKKYHPLLVIANFLVEFLQIHPFSDGNGRISRVLTNLLLLKDGYLYMPYVSHEKIVEDNKPEYYLALRQSQKTFKTNDESILPWLNFFLDIFTKQSEMAIELLSKENVEKILSVKQLAVWRFLQTDKEISPGEIERELKIARPTVNQALVKLLKLRKIEKIGQGSAIRYRRL